MRQRRPFQTRERVLLLPPVLRGYRTRLLANLTTRRPGIPTPTDRCPSLRTSYYTKSRWRTKQASERITEDKNKNRQRRPQLRSNRTPVHFEREDRLRRRRTDETGGQKNGRPCIMQAAMPVPSRYGKRESKERERLLRRQQASGEPLRHATSPTRCARRPLAFSLALFTAAQEAPSRRFALATLPSSCSSPSGAI